MSLSAVLAAAGASPSPSPSGSTAQPVPTLQDAQEHATNAATWVEQNWSTWLAMGLQIV
ncbi:mechanosensitive ion channel family protein, partial [Streptomyces sp. NPDC088921]